MFQRFFSRTARPARRRQTVRGLAPVDALESRLLPTVDLKLSGLLITLGELNQNNNQTCWVNMQMNVENNGNSPVNLTGVADDPSDNVTVRVFASTDNVFDIGDPVVVQNLTIYNDNGSPNNAIAGGSSLIFANGAVLNVDANYKYLIFKVDPDSHVTESVESNNVAIVDMRKPQVSKAWQTVTTQGGNDVFIAPQSAVCDLNTTHFVSASLIIDGAQQKDRLKLNSTGVGSDQLRIVGSKLKLGSQVVGTVGYTHPTNNSNTLKMTFSFDGDQDGVSRLIVSRLFRNLVFHAGPNSIGQRTAHFAVTDNSGMMSTPTGSKINILA